MPKRYFRGVLRAIEIFLLGNGLAGFDGIRRWLGPSGPTKHCCIPELVAMGFLIWRLKVRPPPPPQGGGQGAGGGGGLGIDLGAGGASALGSSFVTSCFVSSSFLGGGGGGGSFGLRVFGTGVCCANCL